MCCLVEQTEESVYEELVLVNRNVGVRALLLHLPMGANNGSLPGLGRYQSSLVSSKFLSVARVEIHSPDDDVENFRLRRLRVVIEDELSICWIRLGIVDSARCKEDIGTNDLLS